MKSGPTLLAALSVSQIIARGDNLDKASVESKLEAKGIDIGQLPKVLLDQLR